ncbi:hypothetical protein ES708_33148 [subsurface metagenome]
MEDNRVKTWFQSKPAKLVSVIIIAFVLGYFVSSLTHKPATTPGSGLSSEQAVSQKWTCSMHPQFALTQPGYPRDLDSFPSLVHSVSALPLYPMGVCVFKKNGFFSRFGSVLPFSVSKSRVRGLVCND